MQNYLFPLWVALGGALGSLCRYGTTIYMARMAGTYFPFGTLAVNGAGSFLIGLLSVLLVKCLSQSRRCLPSSSQASSAASPPFSSFMNETMQYLQAGDILQGFLYLFLQLAGGLLFVMLGWFIGTRVFL